MATIHSDVPHKDNITGSATIIIGGTSGIGFAVASAILSVAGSVFVSSSSADKVTKAISRLATTYPLSKSQIGGRAADLSRAETIEADLTQIFDEAIKFFGRPFDHVVLTAGAPFPPTSLAEFDPVHGFDHATLRILLPMVVGKLAAKFPGKYLRSASSSSITVTSGILAKKPPKGFGAWLFSAGALDTVCRVLSVELAPIRANCVVPGSIKTELVLSLPAETQEEMRLATLAKEIGVPEDIAESYLHCMRNKFMVGEEIVAEGGVLFS